MKDRYSKSEKTERRYPFLKDVLFWTLSLFTVLFITKWIEKSCLNTLLSICIPWMYYQFALLILYIILDFIRIYFSKYFQNAAKRHFFSYVFSFKSILALIVIPAFIFIPNRYISKGQESEYQGIVTDKTTWALTRTASWNNYVKVKLNGENASFWYCLNKESKPLGSKCIVSVKRGIFGMRYVEEVDFLVE